MSDYPLNKCQVYLSFWGNIFSSPLLSPILESQSPVSLNTNSLMGFGDRSRGKERDEKEKKKVVVVV